MGVATPLGMLWQLPALARVWKRKTTRNDCEREIMLI